MACNAEMGTGWKHCGSPGVGGERVLAGTRKKRVAFYFLSGVGVSYKGQETVVSTEALLVGISSCDGGDPPRGRGRALRDPSTFTEEERRKKERKGMYRDVKREKKTRKVHEYKGRIQKIGNLRPQTYEAWREAMRKKRENDKR